MAYEAGVKKSYDINAAIEQAEAQLLKLRADLDASAVALVPLRREKDADATALEMASQKLPALEGTLSAKDRPKARAQALPKQESDHIGPEELVGKLC